MIRINFCAGPGAGKSTLASGVFNALKLKEYSVELITEVAKDYTYEGNKIALKNQLLLFGKQLYREQIASINDIIVTDSPLILNAFWGYYQNYSAIVVQALAHEAFRCDIHQRLITYDLYYFLDRGQRAYKTVGRNEQASEAKDIDRKFLSFWDMYSVTDYGIKHKITPISFNAADVIVKKIADIYGENNAVGS